MMQINKCMTKDDYNTFVKLKEEFVDCLERCGTEIFKMRYNRFPKGEFSIGDFDLFNADEYLTQFERFSCGESDYDQVHVPAQYLYDEQYRADYADLLEDKRLKDVADTIAKKQRLESIHNENREIHDREEYARLKKKYEVIE